MTERRRLTLTDKLAIMTRQARCPLCGEKLGRVDECEFDHEIALVRGGEDTITNLRAVHVACHAVKTHGTKATTRGSDIQEAARDRRLSGDHDEFRRKMLAKAGQQDAEPITNTKGRRKSAWPKRRFGK